MNVRAILTMLPALSLALCLTACGGGGEEEPAPTPSPTSEPVQTQPQAPDAAPEDEDPSLTKLRGEIAATDSGMGVAFLGGLSEGGQEAYDQLTAPLLEDWPFLAGLDWEDAVVVSGMEVYCLVPGDPESHVTVTQWLLNEADGTFRPGEVLYDSDRGDPVLLMGNESDIFPNLRVTVTEPGGQAFSYSPCLSLRDGTLDRSGAEGVYDFSRYYDLAPEGLPDYDGDWAAFDVSDGEGRARTCCLTLTRNGPAEFFYYEEEGSPEVRFTGTVTDNEDDSSVTLDLKSEDGSRTLRGSFRLGAPDADSLYITHLSGDPLLPGTEGDTVLFGRSVG